MATPKSPKKAPVTPVSAAEEAEALAQDEIGETTLSAVQKRFLSRVSRFLVNIQSRRYSARAAREGYGPQEHAEGWRLWSKAAGSDRPLDHWFTEQAQAAELGTIAADRLQLLRDIDTFENTWFPRVRALIRRVIPRDRRDQFAAAFFRNLSQEPLGPGVVGSVRALLLRVEGLAASDEPGAKKVFETLQRRGLTGDKIAEVRALLQKAEAGLEKPSKKAAVHPADLARAQQEQDEAYEDLKDWFNDWGTTLRQVFNAREQVVLGLARPVRAASAGDAAEEEEVEDSDEAEPDEEDPAPAAAAPGAARPRGK